MPTSISLFASHYGLPIAETRPGARRVPRPTPAAARATQAAPDAPMREEPHAGSPPRHASAGEDNDPSGHLAQLFGGAPLRARCESQADLLRGFIDGLTRDASPRRPSRPASPHTRPALGKRRTIARTLNRLFGRDAGEPAVELRDILSGPSPREQQKPADALTRVAREADAWLATAAARGRETISGWRAFVGRRAPALLTIAATVLAAGCREQADPHLIRMNGTLEAPVVDLAPKVTGRVTQVLVREGDRVKAGDLLVKLDIGETAIAVDRDKAAVASAQARARDLEAGSRQREITAAQSEVADRQAAVDLAAKELERQQYLLSRKVGTERDLDRARTDLERAEAALKIARDRLVLTREGTRTWQKEQARTDVARAEAQLRQSETVAAEQELRAPADAIVTHRIAEPGLLLAAGQAALTLTYTDRLYVRTFIPEPQLGRVKPGARAEVTVDAFPGRTFAARVTEISPRAEFTPKAVETREERVNLVYASKVDLTNGWSEPLVPGQPAEVVVRAQPDGAAASRPAQPAPSAQPASPAQSAPSSHPTPSQPPNAAPAPPGPAGPAPASAARPKE